MSHLHDALKELPQGHFFVNCTTPVTLCLFFLSAASEENTSIVSYLCSLTEHSPFYLITFNLDCKLTTRVKYNYIFCGSVDSAGNGSAHTPTHTKTMAALVTLTRVLDHSLVL